MRRGTQVVLASVVAGGLAVVAIADFTGLSIDDLGGGIFRLYAEFDDPDDVVLGVFDANIWNYGGWVHDDIAGGTWRPFPFGGPDDSYVTIGAEPDFSNATAPDENFDDNTSAQNMLGTDAGWYNGNPPNQQGLAGPEGRVLLAQFSGPSETSGELSLAYESQGEERIATGTFGAGPPPEPPCPLFLPHVPYWAGGNPRSVAMGDLDGDSDLDLAVANSGVYGDKVRILLNDGDGTFTTGGNYVAGSGTTFVAIGDVDGDGDLDLALTGANQVLILLNEGGGIFGPYVAYPSYGAKSVAVGDLDGDSDLDLAVANSSPDIVSIFFNNGDGTFAPDMTYEVGNGPGFVAIGDLDSDGDLDLAVAQSYYYISILLNNGDGTFAPEVTYSAPGSSMVAMGDINADGDLDLAVAGYGIGTEDVKILINSGDGTFPSGWIYFGVGGASVVMGDLDSDGDLDLAVGAIVQGATDHVSILLNDGNGMFVTDLIFPVGNWPKSVAIGDLDADSDLDLAVANVQVQDRNVSILLNTCPLACTADVNGDHLVDGNDLGVLLGAWGAADSPTDINADGTVDGTDLGILLANWGPCPE